MKIILALLLLAGTSYGQTGFTFLEIPVGARESALGGAGVALISGPTSAAHNPAALAHLKHTSFAALTTRHFGDSRASFFGLNIRARKFSLTPHFWGTTVPDIEYRTSPTRDPISTFDASYSAVGVSSGWKVTNEIAVGVTARYLHSKINFESAEGWSSDLGILVRPKVEQLSIGAAVNHLGAVNQYATEDVTLPTTVRVGAAWQQELGTAGGLMFTAEGAKPREHDTRIAGGVEYRAPQYLALRVGYVSGLEAQGVSFGAGLNYNRFTLDYAFLPYKEELGEGHRVGLGIEL
ncbi:MAG: PorV/PorQ family protein [Calditrichaeota bacterium]|nr:PorV/PorQ family protein [Calditrichota bacterium]MCB9369625.1 PorV/PorQ family protein [Calditrichota bacterium]